MNVSNSLGVNWPLTLARLDPFPSLYCISYSSAHEWKSNKHTLQILAAFAALFRQHCGKCTVKGFTMAGMLAGHAAMRDIYKGFPPTPTPTVLIT